MSERLQAVGDTQQVNVEAEISVNGKTWFRDREVQLRAAIWTAANIVQEFQFQDSTHIWTDRPLHCPQKCGSRGPWLIIRDGEIRCPACDEFYTQARTQAALDAEKGTAA